MIPCATCVKNIVFPVKTAFMYAALTNCPSSTVGNTQRISCPDFHSLCSAGKQMIFRLCLLHRLWHPSMLPTLGLWAPTAPWRKSAPPASGQLFPTLPAMTGTPRRNPSATAPLTPAHLNTALTSVCPNAALHFGCLHAAP